VPSRTVTSIVVTRP